MIIWFNCKISDKRLAPIPSKGNLREYNRFDATRYAFASFVPLEPNISKIFFNLELDEPYTERTQEMEDWIYSLFPAEKVRIQWHRCMNIDEWKKVQVEIDEVNDDIIYLAGCEDYVFMCKNTDVWNQGIDLIKKDPSPTAVMAMCHYHEAMVDACKTGVAKLTECGNFITAPFHGTYSIFVMKKELYHMYLEAHNDPSRTFYRSDGFWVEFNKTIYAPTIELAKHYDGYAFQELSICPPLEIPLGFFEKNIVIRYGFNDRDNTCVNINPLLNLYAADINGTDYKWTLKDIPAFWKPYIKKIIINDNIDEHAFAVARDQLILAITAKVPKEYVQKHLLVK